MSLRLGIRHDRTTGRARAVQASEGHALARELQSTAEEALEGSVRYTEANPATGEGVSATMALLTKQALLARARPCASAGQRSSRSPREAVVRKQSGCGTIVGQATGLVGRLLMNVWTSAECPLSRPRAVTVN